MKNSKTDKKDRANQLEIKSLTKTFRNGSTPFTALKNISLSIKQGEQIAIIGKSGSGKSTLMHIMSILDSPTEGEVFVDGKNTTHLSEGEKDRLRNKVFGFVFQQFFLNPNQTVIDNITLPLKIQGMGEKERKKKGKKLLKDIGLEDKEREKAVNLSGGQKQRVAIARALANDPLVIFADEPTGNLDTDTGDQIIKLLFQYSNDKNITLIIVTHDDEISDLCKRKIHIKDGEIENKK